MQNDVKKIWNLMKMTNVTIADLQEYCLNLGISEKFPFKIFYTDKTQSDDVDFYQECETCYPVGVVIDNTVYTFPRYVDNRFCGDAETYCQKRMGNNMKGTLPTRKQLEVLQANLEKYENISAFLAYPKLSECFKLCFAIAHSQNSQNTQYMYDFDKGEEIATDSFSLVLPVINL